MAEAALYKQLENYNETIPNKYKDNWGSLLSYLNANDTKYLNQMANNKEQPRKVSMTRETSKPTRNESRRFA